MRALSGVEAQKSFGDIMNDHLNRTDRLVVLRIVAIYAVFSSVWIFLSDTVLSMFTHDSGIFVRYSLFKGLLFISMTAFLLYQLIVWHVQKTKQAEENVRKSEQRLTEAQKIAHIGSWEWDMLIDRTVWSDELCRIYGIEPGTVQPTYEDFLNRVHPDDRGETDLLIKQAAGNHEPFCCYHRIIRSDGAVRTLLSQGRVIVDDTGQPKAMMGTCQDVTELKQVEEELKKLNEELETRVAKRTAELGEAYLNLQKETAERVKAIEDLRGKEQLLIQQSRMAAMGEMLGNIAHQWRQPLNVLGLLIQRLGLSYESGGFSKELLDDSIGKSMEIILHLSQTIDDFWNFSIPDREKCQFSLDQVIAKAVSLIKDSFKELRIIIDTDTIGAPRINGYPNEFAQVLLKILMNAKDALLEQGTIDARVTVRSWTEDGRAVVTITDNGGGIRDEIMGKIFDPYFTTKELGKGIGVGLFMAKIIIEKNMGGRLTVRNISGGAEFRIEV